MNKFKYILIIFVLFFSNIDHLYALGIAHDFVIQTPASASHTQLVKPRFDSEGNMYHVYRFSGTVDFDPGSGTSQITATGTNGLALVKYDADGNFIWAKEVGGYQILNSNYYGFDIDTDTDDIYITGGYSGTFDFDPGAGTTNATSGGSDDIFVSKFNSDGEFVWVKTMVGSGSVQDTGFNVLVGENHIYISGFARSNPFDIDPGAGTTELERFGHLDAYIAKFEFDGDFVWGLSMGSETFGDLPTYQYLDENENIYTAGAYREAMNVGDAGAGDIILPDTGTNYSAYITKHNSSGELQWAKSFHSASANEYAQAVDADDNGNLYIAIEFYGVVDLDPGAGTEEYTPVGTNDLAIVKLDSDGDFVWAKQLSGSGAELVRSLSIENDKLYVSGSFPSTVDFDPGDDEYNVTSLGGSDGFIAVYDLDGEFEYVYRTGGTNTGYQTWEDDAYTGFNFHDGYLYASGFFRGTIDFDNSSETDSRTSSSGLNQFIQRFTIDSAGPTVSSVSATGRLNDATITWTTNENASSQISYGLTESYGTNTAEENTSTRVTSHSMTLSNLDCGTTYNYKITSKDAFNQSSSESNRSFTTENCLVFGYVSRPSSSFKNTSVEDTKKVENLNIDNKFKFTRNLSLGMRNDDVKKLQEFLNQHGILVSETGPGSIGNETNYFGVKTKNAVIKFQEKYFDNILKPLNLSKATGFVGTSTRNQLNSF